MPARRIIWTQEMDAALIEGSSKNLGARRLGKIIGVDRRIVGERRAQLGIPPAKRLGRPKKMRNMNERPLSRGLDAPKACERSARASIESSMERLERTLRWIDDPAARKIVIVNKALRGELSGFEAERLIRRLGLVNA